MITDLPISSCPSGMIYGACSCQPSCDDPRLTQVCDPCAETEMCICRDGLFKKGNTCVLPQECGCYSSETKSVIAVRYAIVTILFAIAKQKCFFNTVEKTLGNNQPY